MDIPEYDYTIPQEPFFKGCPVFPVGFCGNYCARENHMVIPLQAEPNFIICQPGKHCRGLSLMACAYYKVFVPSVFLNFHERLLHLLLIGADLNRGREFGKAYAFSSSHILGQAAAHEYYLP